MLKLNELGEEFRNLNLEDFIVLPSSNGCCDCYFSDADYCELINCSKGVYKKIEAITREEAIKAMLEGKKVKPLECKNEECSGYAYYDPSYSIPFRWVVGEGNDPLKGMWYYKEWIIVG